MPDLNCPDCGARPDPKAGWDLGPEEGSFTVCYGCSALLVFGTNATALYHPSNTDMKRLNDCPDMLRIVERTQMEATLARKRQRKAARKARRASSQSTLSMF